MVYYAAFVVGRMIQPYRSDIPSLGTLISPVAGSMKTLQAFDAVDTLQARATLRTWSPESSHVVLPGAGGKRWRAQSGVRRGSLEKKRPYFTRHFSATLSAEAAEAEVMWNTLRATAEARNNETYFISQTPVV